MKILSFFFFLFFYKSYNFQNLKVSSAEADTILSPSGLYAKCKTLFVWPYNSPFILFFKI